MGRILKWRGNPEASLCVFFTVRRFTSDAKRGAPLPGVLIDEVKSAKSRESGRIPAQKLKSAIEMQRRSVDTSTGVRQVEAQPREEGKPPCEDGSAHRHLANSEARTEHPAARHPAR